MTVLFSMFSRLTDLLDTKNLSSSSISAYLLGFSWQWTHRVKINCGKPSVAVVGDDGKRRFPGHAQASQNVWMENGGDPSLSWDENLMAARLMGMDMDVHLLKGDGVEEFSARPEAVSLLLTGLAEVHANASMFGGIGSDSFKIKWKHLDRRGRQIVSRISETTSPSAAI